MYEQENNNILSFSDILLINKVGDRSRGRLKGSLFINFYTVL